MDIFIIRDGRQTGPFSAEAVKAQLTEGSARPTDLGWRKGMAEWRALGEVLRPLSEKPGDPATPPPAGIDGSNGAEEKPASGKQKAFLKYLGAEFGENLTKERAALAISDALETPKLQMRIRKWQEDKLRLHPELFQDEIDFRRANRSSRYLERIQTEGSDMLKDVTKAHVQVIVESLDKRQPAWESDREAAFWDHLLPAIGEHFPQLVAPAYKNRLKPGGPAKTRNATTRGMASAAGVTLPPKATGTFGAMLRGVVLGAIALGAILAGQRLWEKSRGSEEAQHAPKPQADVPAKKEAPVVATKPAAKEPAAEPPVKPIAEAKAPDAAPATAPAVPAPNDPPVPVTPPMNLEQPASPAEKPPTPEEKPMAPVSGAPAAAPAAENPPATPPAPAPAPAPRNAVTLTQGIGVMLPNGQVTLRAGTVLRYLGTEGANVRVSWNNNVFFVPALATNINEPATAPAPPAATPPASNVVPAVPGTPNPQAPPKKPADDL